MRWPETAVVMLLLAGSSLRAQPVEPAEPWASEDDSVPAGTVAAVAAPLPPDSAEVPRFGAGAADADEAAGENRDGCTLESNRRTAQIGAAGVFVGGNIYLFRRFKQAWWSGEKADGFFFRADWDEDFRDQDKFGHLWGGYHLTRAGHTLLRGACVSERRALVISALYATLFQLQIEIWDGLYDKYGFSYPDLLANTAGMGLAVLHAVKPETKVVKPTISYHRTEALKRRGPSDELRYSLDYSGQTYWFSFDVDAMLPTEARRYWPGLLRLSVGHTITDWVLPRPDGVPAETPQGVTRARRKLLLSLDIDANKLPGNHPVWRFVKEQLSFIRLPAPAIQITPDARFIKWYR